MKILCKTLFDCSCTGVVGFFRPAQLPFKDKTGKAITDQQSWIHARNQQRNWETIMQIISLRAQPMEVSMPRVVDNVWQFEFEVETAGVYSTNLDPNNLDGLLNECHGIPMIGGLDSKSVTDSTMITSGSNQNIWFETINNTLD